MGKKNKKSKSALAHGLDGDTNNLPRNVKRETLEIASQLLEKCSHQCCSSSHEWETYMEIQEMVTRLITIQANYVMKPTKRTDHISEFMTWLSDQEVDASSVSIQPFEHGLGLQAEKLFNENELVLSIPRKIMMTTDTAKQSVLGAVMEEDRILQSMPNVVLALHILCEKNNPESQWKSYLNVLPETYNTLLYFSPEEVQLLKGSPIFEEVINQFRSIARQYAYFFKLFNSPGENKVPLKVFCYEDYSEPIDQRSKLVTDETNEPVTDETNQPVTDETNEPVTDETNEPVTDETNQPVTDETNQPVTDETNQPVTDETNQPVTDETNQPVTDETNQPVTDETNQQEMWAVSTVMTRQNKIPSISSQHMCTALIPLWDMANHTSGQLTTDYNMEEDCSKCYALRAFHPGQQVFIFYGSRSNAELLLHNGFVYTLNECDRISIKLGISKNDVLYNMKAEVLARLTLLPSRQFQLHKGTDPVDSDTLAYLRVFNMNEDELRHYLTSQDASKYVSRLRDFGEVVSVDNEDKVWQFLKTRAELLVKSYPTTVEDDEELLTGETLSEHARLCVQLRLAEKRLLLNTATYSQEYRLKFHTQLQQEAEKAMQKKAMNMSATVTEIDQALDDLENLDLVEAL